MDGPQFWQLIEDSRAGAGDSPDGQAGQLRDALEQLPTDAVMAFAAAFVEANHRLYTWDHWGAATVLLGGCGDDTFTDFRSWVISRGRATYESFLADPDSDVIAAAGPADHEEIGAAELFSYTAAEVLEARTDAEHWAARPDRMPLETQAEPTGEPFDESDDVALTARYPRLAAAHRLGDDQFDEIRGRRFRRPRWMGGQD